MQVFSFCTLEGNLNCFQIAHEVDMICHVEKTASMFEDSWKTYAQIILRYSKSILFMHLLKMFFVLNLNLFFLNPSVYA